MQNVFGQRCARNIIKGYGTPLKSNNWNAIYAPQDNSNYWGVRDFCWKLVCWIICISLVTMQLKPFHARGMKDSEHHLYRAQASHASQKIEHLHWLREQSKFCLQLSVVRFCASCHPQSRRALLRSQLTCRADKQLATPATDVV